MSGITTLVESCEKIIDAANTPRISDLVIRLNQIDDNAAILGPDQQKIVINLSQAVLTARMNHENPTLRPRSS